MIERVLLKINLVIMLLITIACHTIFGPISSHVGTVHQRLTRFNPCDAGPEGVNEGSSLRSTSSWEPGSLAADGADETPSDMPSDRFGVFWAGRKYVCPII